MRYVFTAAMVTVILATPVRAQMGNNAPEKTPLQLKYEREDKERAENESAYNTQMKRLKALRPATTNADPWKGVRATPDSPAKR